jgi:hypothetical protein
MEVVGQLQVLAPPPPPLEEWVPGTHWIGGWVGYKSGLDAVEKRKVLHCRELNPDRPARNPSFYHLSYPGSLIVIVGNVIVNICLVVCFNLRIRELGQNFTITKYSF